VPNVSPEQFGQLALPGMERGSRVKPFTPRPHAHISGDLLRQAAESTKWRGADTKHYGTDAIKKRVHDDIERGRPAINFDSYNMRTIAEAVGEFHNQHMTRTSNGSLAPDYRANYERRAFGFDHDSDPRSEHPVYGYLYNPQRKMPGGVEHYGNVRAILKPHVVDRTTITADDSLGRGVPLPLKTVAEGKAPKLFYSHADSGGYTEAQYHGSVGWDDDVDHIEFKHEDGDAMNIKDIAERTNKPWRSMRTEIVTQDPLPVQRSVMEHKAVTDKLEAGLRPGMSMIEKQQRVRRMLGMVDRDIWGGTHVYPTIGMNEIEVERSKNFGEQWRG
jgi:hypothetical protein